MKIQTIFCISALAIAPLALANVSVTPQALGQVEATLKFCSSVNPKAEAKYKEMGKMLVSEATEEELKKVRETSDYKDSYDEITKQLEKAPKDEAVKACTAFLEEK